MKRWCMRYDGSDWRSLSERSHRPHSSPSQHTAKEECQIKTDNGTEFTYKFISEERISPMDQALRRLGIAHVLIPPRTPWHNGKAERSHRNDQERFYNHLSFYSYEDLQLQMRRYLYRSNRIPMAVLGWQSPIQKRQALERTCFC